MDPQTLLCRLQGFKNDPDEALLLSDDEMLTRTLALSSSPLISTLLSQNTLPVDVVKELAFFLHDAFSGADAIKALLDNYDRHWDLTEVSDPHHVMILQSLASVLSSPSCPAEYLEFWSKNSRYWTTTPDNESPLSMAIINNPSTTIGTFSYLGCRLPFPGALSIKASRDERSKTDAFAKAFEGFADEVRLSWYETATAGVPMHHDFLGIEWDHHWPQVLHSLAVDGTYWEQMAVIEHPNTADETLRQIAQPINAEDDDWYSSAIDRYWESIEEPNYDSEIWQFEGRSVIRLAAIHKLKSRAR